MRLMISGSRDWPWLLDEPIITVIKKLRPKNDILIHGGCRKGVDAIAEEKAHELGIHTARVDALWDKYNKSAGPIRNRAMLLLRPDALIAFPKHVSAGTDDAINGFVEKYGSDKLLVYRLKLDEKEPYTKEEWERALTFFWVKNGFKNLGQPKMEVK